MKILGVYLENIRSYKKGIIVFPPRDITVIYGPTGSGKTSLLMAIMFALFGIPHGGKGIFEAYKTPQGADLLRADSKIGRVRILIQVGRKLHLIERVIEKDITKGEIKYQQKGGLIEEYTIEETRILKQTQRRILNTATELNEYVANILGIREKKRDIKRTSPLVFTTAMYVPQFKTQEALEMDVNERLEVIERALGLDKYKIFKSNYEKIRELVNAKIKEKTSKLDLKQKIIESKNKEKLEKELDTLRQELYRVEKDESLIEKEINRLQSLIDQLVQEINVLSAEKENIRARIQDYETKSIKQKNLETALMKILGSNIVNESTINKAVSDIEARIEDLKSLQQSINTEISELYNELARVSSLKKAIEDEYGKKLQELSSHRKERELLEENLFLLKNKLSEVRGLINNGICPVCRQKITHEHGQKLLMEIEDEHDKTQIRVEQIKQKLSLLDTEINELLEKKKSIDEQEAKLRSRVQSLIGKKDEVASSLNQLLEARTRLHSLVEQWRTLRDEISSIDLQELNTRLRDIDDKIRIIINQVERTKDQHRKAVETKSELARKAGSLKSRIDTLEKEIKEINKLQEEIEQDKKELDKLKSINDLLEFAKQTVEEVEKQLMKRLVDEFRKYFYLFIDTLAPDQPLELVVTDDFGLEGKIKIGRTAFRINSPSGGQNIAISLAYRLALNQLVRTRSRTLRKGVLILDEPTTGFSRELVSRLRDLLRLMSGVEGQVIVVTHDETLIDAGDCKIKLSRDPVDHQTSIEYDECHFDENYKEMVERLLKGLIVTKDGEQVVRIGGSFEPKITPDRTKREGNTKSILHYVSNKEKS